MEIINGSAQREFRQLERLMFEMMGRAPHLSLFQLTNLRGRVEDLLIMMSDDDEHILPQVEEVEVEVQYEVQDQVEVQDEVEEVQMEVSEDLNAAFILEEIRNDDTTSLDIIDNNNFEFDESIFDFHYTRHNYSDFDAYYDELVESQAEYYYREEDTQNRDDSAILAIAATDFENADPRVRVSIKNHTKCVSKKKLKSLTLDICSICHDKHSFAEVSTMNCCGQDIGHECFNKWIFASRLPTCPCCREKSPSYVTYHPYAKKTKPVEVVDLVSGV